MTTSARSAVLLVPALAVAGWFHSAGGFAASANQKNNLQRNPDAVKAFMRGKLDASQQILEGLVVEDFELIEKGADRLVVMSLRAEWNVVKSDEYDQQSKTFRRSVRKLAEMAEDENLDGAALAYLQATMRCVNCHKATRGAEVAGRDGSSSSSVALAPIE